MDAGAPAPERLEHRLLPFLQAQLPAAQDLALHDIRRTSSGKSRENWVFDASWHESGAPHRLALILRRDPTDSVLRTERRIEFGVLAALAGSALPAPRVHFLDEDGSQLGRPSLVMERIDGDCDWELLNGSAPLAERLDLAHRLLALLADVHAVDWRARGLEGVLGHPGPRPGLTELARWEAELRRVQLEPHPELEIVIDWLRRHCAPRADTVLVHGDFKPGNILLRNNRIVALLDWETAHLGDPLEDLGWMLNPTRAREHQIAGHWERAQVVAQYQRLTGRSVDPDALHWWIVFANFKLAVIVLTGVKAYLDGGLDQAYLGPTWIIRTLMRTLRQARS